MNTARKFTPPALVAALTILCLGIAQYDMGAQPLWIDETASVWKSSRALPDVSDAAAVGAHAPAYFWVLHAWTVFGGYGEFHLRLFSAVCVALSVPAAYLLGRAVSNRVPVGLATAALMVMSPFVMQYAREARPYAFMMLVGTVGLVCAYSYLSRHRDGSRPWIAGAGLWSLRLDGWRPVWNRDALRADLTLAGIAVSVLLMAGSHHTALLYPAALTPAALLTARAGREHWKVHLCNGAILAIAVATVYCILFLPALWNSVSSYYYPEVTIHRVIGGMVSLYGGHRVLIAPLLLCALSAVGALRLWRSGQRLSVGLLVPAVALLPAAEVLYSVAVQPVFTPRTLLWTLPPFLALAASGLVPLWNLRAVWLLAVTAVVGVLVYASVVGIRGEYVRVKQPWDRAVMELAAGWQPGDAVLVCPPAATYATDYYWTRLGGPVVDDFYYTSGEDLNRVLDFGAGDYGAYSRRAPAVDVRISDMPERHGRVWLLQHRRSVNCDEEASRALLGARGLLAYPRTVADGGRDERERRAEALLERAREDQSFTLMLWRYDGLGIDAR